MSTKLGVPGLSSNEDDVSQRGTISTVDAGTIVAGKPTKRRETTADQKDKNKGKTKDNRNNLKQKSANDADAKSKIKCSKRNSKRHTTIDTAVKPEHVVEEQRKKNSRRRRQRLVYSDTTYISMKQWLADFEKNLRRAPHVISHYTAGVRLIGLTTRQLEQQMNIMVKSASKNDSAYAKPLQFAHYGRKVQTNTVQRKKRKVHSVVDRPTGSNRNLVQGETAQKEQDPAVTTLSKKIKDMMILLAQKKGSITPQDDSLIMQLRKQIGTVTDKMFDKKTLKSSEFDHEILSDKAKSFVPMKLNLDKSKPCKKHVYGKRKAKITANMLVKKTLESSEFNHQTVSTMRAVNKAKSVVMKLKSVKSKTCKKRMPVSYTPGKRKAKRGRKKSLLMGLKWTTPRIQYHDVPLPTWKMKQTVVEPTFDNIRAKAKQSVDVYYHNLRQAEIRNAWEHWDRLYASAYLPNKLLDNFRTIYSAYTPRHEEESFVVCPWNAEHFLFVRHIQKSASFSIPKVN